MRGVLNVAWTMLPYTGYNVDSHLFQGIDTQFTHILDILEFYAKPGTQNGPMASLKQLIEGNRARTRNAPSMAYRTATLLQAAKRA